MIASDALLPPLTTTEGITAIRCARCDQPVSYAIADGILRLYPCQHPDCVGRTYQPG